ALAVAVLAVLVTVSAKLYTPSSRPVAWVAVKVTLYRLLVSCCVIVTPTGAAPLKLTVPVNGPGSMPFWAMNGPRSGVAGIDAGSVTATGSAESCSGELVMVTGVVTVAVEPDGAVPPSSRIVTVIDDAVRVAYVWLPSTANVALVAVTPVWTIVPPVVV